MRTSRYCKSEYSSVWCAYQVEQAGKLLVGEDARAIAMAALRARQAALLLEAERLDEEIR